MLGGNKFGMEAGFTLIEITIVLAILSGLAALAFVGQGELRSNARFNDSVERTVSALSSARNDANTTLNTRSSGGTDGSRVFFGVLAEFKEGEEIVQMTPLWGEGQSCPPVVITEEPDQIQEFEIPWGAIPVDYDQAVVFGRRCNDGRPTTYTPDADTPGAILRTIGAYSTLPASQPPAVIKLDDQDGHCAEITVEHGSGNISQEYVAC